MSQFLKAPAPGFDDPLNLLRACHDRIRERLDTLERLPGHLARCGADVEACAAVRRILAYFDGAAPHHHADEDRDLFPLLLAAEGRSGWDAKIPAILDRLAGEHPRLEQGWGILRIDLEAVTEGEARPLSEAAAWVRMNREHLALEETHVLPLAARLLNSRELERLGRAMARRRGVAFPGG